MGRDSKLIAGTAPPALPVEWVSSRVRVTEPWVLGSMALLAAGVAACAWPSLPVSWALALLPLAAAFWSVAEVASHPAPIALRGTLMACAALLLQFRHPVDAELAAVLAQAWLGFTCAAYATLLRPRWSWGIVAFSVGALAMLRSLAGVELPRLLGDELLLVLVPALLGAALGARLRRADQRREGHHADLATGLRNRAGLLACGQERVDHARRQRRPVTLAVLDMRDLREVRAIYGAAAARTMAERVSSRLAAIAGQRGLASRCATTEFALLLPGTSHEASRAIAAVLGTPSRIECEVDGDEIVLVPELALAEVEHDEGDLGELLAFLSRKLASSRESEARRHQYLRKERERHSRPMALPASARSAGALSPA